MKFTVIVSMSVLLSLFGCADPSYNQVAIEPATGERVEPAKYAKFHSILNASKLQISKPNSQAGSKYELALDSDFSGIVNDYFYVDKGSSSFVFKMEGYKLRNELRVLENFKSDTPEYYRLSANLMLINPMKSIEKSPHNRDEMTLLQVHNKGTFDDGLHGVGYIPHPLVRVVWEAERRGVQNHYWAVIKNNAVNCGSDSGNRELPVCKKAYKRVALGPASSGVPVRFDVLVGDQTLIIKVNGTTKVNHDISYWKHLLSYFKAGVYNQFENGQSEVHFHTLEYGAREFH
ncbi:polysaccharide lyase family 7 protein [Vibrio sonorensis]|uniref:polysaccharide lyase family 7 protein n=1 Tax=Vibrio sonorensis TaxID=1004316 RepID=UPI001C30B158|nr:polysaccharide lyase family 7 protein [Vibrio sonorensis]